MGSNACITRKGLEIRGIFTRIPHALGHCIVCGAHNDFGLLRLQAPDKCQRSGSVRLGLRRCWTFFHSRGFNMTELILQQLTNRPEKCLLLAVFA